MLYKFIRAQMVLVVQKEKLATAPIKEMLIFLLNSSYKSKDSKLI